MPLGRGDNPGTAFGGMAPFNLGGQKTSKI